MTTYEILLASEESYRNAYSSLERERLQITAMLCARTQMNITLLKTLHQNSKKLTIMPHMSMGVTNSKMFNYPIFIHSINSFNYGY